jgi:hypothetical protein
MYLLRFTEENVFPPVRTLTQSHCKTMSELCIPQFEHSVLKASPLPTIMKIAVRRAQRPW